MANISILDTGRFSITDVTSTQATRANSGNEIELKAVDVSFERKANIDMSEIINTNTGPVVGFGSVTAGKITIRGMLDGNSASDMNLMDEINDMLSTYGTKLLYYNNTSDGYRDITDSLGDTYKNDVHKDEHFSGTATGHLHVRFISFQITQTSNSILRYTLEAVETL